MVQIADRNESFLAGGNGDDLLLAQGADWTAAFQTDDRPGVDATARLSLTEDGLRIRIDADGFQPGDDFRLLLQPAGEGEAAELASGQVADDGTVSLDVTFGMESRAMAEMFPLEGRSFSLDGLGVESAPIRSAGDGEDGDGVLMAGGNGDDVLVGGALADLLVGGNGADMLAGGAGDDDLVGGRGADTFVVGNGKDAISDFNPQAGDRVQFDGDVDLSDLVARQTAQGLWLIVGDGAVDDPATDGVLLVGVRASSAAQVTDWLA